MVSSCLLTSFPSLVSKCVRSGPRLQVQVDQESKLHKGGIKQFLQAFCIKSVYNEQQDASGDRDTTPNIMYTIIYCNKATGTLHLLSVVSSRTQVCVCV